MRGGTAVRFAIEAAFLVGVAAIVAAMKLSVPAIVVVIFAAWAIAAVFEWGVSRRRRAPAGEGAAVAVALSEPPDEAKEAEPKPELAAPEPAAAEATEVAPAERRPLFRPRPQPVQPEPAGAEDEGDVRVLTPAMAAPSPAEPVAAPTPAAVQEAGVPPEEPPEVSPEPAAAEAEPSVPELEPSVPEPEPRAPEPEPPVPEPPVLVALPSPPAEPPAAEPVEAPAASAEVVALPSRGPREWNLWDLERLTREHSGADLFRDEERTYLLVYLREFANSDGLLPVDFDGLVRESFGDLVGAG